MAAVGIAGLTLGGGMGWLMRKHGMTIDNLLEVDVVTADGRLLTATETEHHDLFWALRGGGGNFGIATGFRYRLHPVETVLGGAIVYPATREGLRAYAEATAAAPDELTTITFVGEGAAAAVHPRRGARHAGAPDPAVLHRRPRRRAAGAGAAADARRSHSARRHDRLRRRIPALYDLTDMAAISRPHAIRNAFLRELAGRDDRDHPRLRQPRDLSVRSRRAPRVGRRDGARPGRCHRLRASRQGVLHRRRQLLGGRSQRPERHVAWTEAFWQAVAPYTDGAYAGFLGDEGDDRVRAAYPPATYARLAAIKRRYDPDNVFRSNANIQPA